MVKTKLRKVIASSLIIASALTFSPIKVSAAWMQNNTGWWYAENNSYITGWKQIEGKWYYFNANGYMVHDAAIDGYILGSDGALIENAATTKDSKIVDVTVGNAQEFVNALGSNKRIILKPGIYNLSEINQINSSDNSISWETVQDGKELNVRGIHNLTIEGMDSGKVEIKVTPRFANIINFTNVSNITIKNIIAGHTPSPYECNAGVLNFTNSSEISINNSELYGCGSIGLSLNNVKKLEAANCKIDHCSLRAIQINDSEAIKFTENKIVNHEAYSNIIMLSGAKDVTFEKCEFADNNKFSWSFIEASNNSAALLDKCIIRNNSKADSTDFGSDKINFFDTTDFLGKSDSKITIKDSEITNNKCDYLADNKENVTFENCTLANDNWN